MLAEQVLSHDFLCAEGRPNNAAGESIRVVRLRGVQTLLAVHMVTETIFWDSLCGRIQKAVQYISDEHSGASSPQ